MPDDRFEARLRALAQQLSRSISEVDLDEVADRLGVDPDRVRGAAGAVEDWLNDRASVSEPLFSTGPGEPHEYMEADSFAQPERTAPARTDGPHPLDLPTDHQGRALSALASGRWTIRPGSGRLSTAEPAVGPGAPDDEDLAGELRARDWIAADGAVTLVGQQALLRWCRTAENEADRTRAEQAGAAVPPVSPDPAPAPDPARSDAPRPDPPIEPDA
jgi:hypothetical protein